MSRNKRTVIPNRKAPNAPTFDNDFLEKQPRQQGASTFNTEDVDFSTHPSRSIKISWNGLLEIGGILGLLGVIVGVIVYFIRLSDSLSRIDKNAEAGITLSTRIEYKVDTLSDRVKDVEQQMNVQPNNPPKSTKQRVGSE